MDERLIEVSFPLQQTSLDSVHEKNVRHGHISTLHIWPARRPLAASRAALITTLLPDPGTTEDRKELLLKLGGRLAPKAKSKKQAGGKVEQTNEETEGGILHWGRETSKDLDWFRAKIREAYGGRVPKVLDPFAGGGAIPLEAMRLGCEVTAADINPVAWFILKCTLEYPQRLAGQHRPLPEFVLKSREFMENYFKAKGLKGAALKKQLTLFGLEAAEPVVYLSELMGIADEKISIETDLAWHVRAWGWWVLQQAKAELERFYPTIDGKPTVAYLWARTVTCKNCRATVPLLKTRWLCRKDKKRIILTMKPNAQRTGVIFGIQNNVPKVEGTTAQRREHDKKTGSGTISGSGATCPCCGTIMTREDLQQAGLRGELNATMTAVVVDGAEGKEYRLPCKDEIDLSIEAAKNLSDTFAGIPYGLPQEPIPQGASRSGGGSSFTVTLYGLTQWSDLFTPRQLLALGTFVKYTRAACKFMKDQGYDSEWIRAVVAYLAIGIDKLADYIAALCTWHVTGEKMSHVFVRFAIPVNWDFAELNPLSNSSGNYWSCLDWVSRVVEANTLASENSVEPHVFRQSAIAEYGIGKFDAIVTDPPYYDAISYSDLMDFFYIWLRRTLYGLSPEFDAVFQQPLSPKWDHEQNDGELIDEAIRFDGDRQKSKANYENGMARVFQNCYKMLTPDGRMVVVFANKSPDAWETLVSAIIRAGFVVTGSWPIQTEMGNRTRAISSAALASSIWHVCRKRPENARDGWDSQVLEEMQRNIVEKLHNFWDAGIRGPDFVWAATGPALEAYSKHPKVKKLNEPGQLLNVKEFLIQARRIVLDFVVGQVLRNDQEEAASSLDAVTTYYLLHRHYFGTESVPIGPCILYAVSCGLSDSDLVNRYDLLARSGGLAAKEEDEEEDEIVEESEEEEGTGSAVRLKQWYQRKGTSLGYGTPSVPIPPLIDQVHRLMHLWKAGEEAKLNEYLDEQGLEQNTLFHRLLQALIELHGANSEERGMLESISNYVKKRKVAPNYRLGL